MGADFYSGNLHKWLCAPKGSAFLFAGPEVQHLVEPLVVSWGWYPEKPGVSPFIDQQEWTGTRDISAFLSVPAAIKFQEQHDWDRVRRDCHALLKKTLDRTVEITGLPTFYGSQDTWYAQMATVLLPSNVDIEVIKVKLYDEYHIEVPLILWNGTKLMRLSIQGYNSERDASALIAALRKLL